MFRQEDNKEQDFSIIEVALPKTFFFSILKLLISWLAGAFFAYIVCFGVANMNA